MVKRGTPLPEKLKADSIIEALLELRFLSKTIIPEVFFGRFVDSGPWKEWEQRQLPASNIPPQIRANDPLLQFTPVIELADPSNSAVIRLGGSVLSYHRRPPYPGWGVFKPCLEEVVASLYKSMMDVAVTRLGFRYLNALGPQLHHIRSLDDLYLESTVSDDLISKSVNINFVNDIGQNSSCAVRIATPDLIQGAIPPDTSVFVDVDVYTKDGFRTNEKAAVIDWIGFAHTNEKEQFFRLFKQETIDALKGEIDAKWNRTSLC